MARDEWKPRPLSKPLFVEVCEEVRQRLPDGRWQVGIVFLFDGDAGHGGRPQNTEDPRYEQLRQALLLVGWRTIKSLIGYDPRDVHKKVKRRDAELQVQDAVGEKDLARILEHGRRMGRDWTAADTGRELNRWDRKKLPILQRLFPGTGGDLQSLVRQELDVLQALQLGRNRAKEFARDYRAATAEYRRTKKTNSGVLLLGGGPRPTTLARLWIAMHGWVNPSYLWFDRVADAPLLDAATAIGQLMVGVQAPVTTQTARTLLKCAACERPANEHWSEDELAVAIVRSQALNLINLPNLAMRVEEAEAVGGSLEIIRKDP